MYRWSIALCSALGFFPYFAAAETIHVHVTVNAVVETLQEETRLRGAIVNLLGGDIRRTGPNGGAQVRATFTSSGQYARVHRTVTVCAKEEGYFVRCLSFDVSSSRSTSITKNIKFRLISIPSFLANFFLDAFGRPITGSELQAIQSDVRNQGIDDVARWIAETDEGRFARAKFFFESIGLSYSDSDLTELATRLGQISEEAAFAEVLRSHSIAPIVLRTGKYLRHVIDLIYRQYLDRAPSGSELAHGLSVVAQTHSQRSLILFVVSTDDYGRK